MPTSTQQDCMQLSAWLETWFGCQHKNLSFPITRREPGGKRLPTKRVCLSCGKEFDFDLEEMKVSE